VQQPKGAAQTRLPHTSKVHAPEDIDGCYLSGAAREHLTTEDALASLACRISHAMFGKRKRWRPVVGVDLGRQEPILSLVIFLPSNLIFPFFSLQGISCKTFTSLLSKGPRWLHQIGGPRRVLFHYSTSIAGRFLQPTTSSISLFKSPFIPARSCLLAHKIWF